jgi:hypothetical protein
MTGSLAAMKMGLKVIVGPTLASAKAGASPGPADGAPAMFVHGGGPKADEIFARDDSRARLKARASKRKSGSINFARRFSSRAAMRKYRSERNGRRSFDTGVQ